MKACQYYSHALQTFAAFDASGQTSVFSIDRTQPFVSRVEDLIGGGESVIIIDLSRLFRRVDSRLAAVTNFKD